MTQSFTAHDIDSALQLAADIWDDAIQHGLHEAGIPVSDILRALVGGERVALNRLAVAVEALSDHTTQNAMAMSQHANQQLALLAEEMGRQKRHFEATMAALHADTEKAQAETAVLRQQLKDLQGGEWQP